METALTFNDITFSPVNHQNSLWIRAVELAKALGFKREDQAAKIYRAHTDEFTADMAQVVEITDNAESAFPVKSLLFSLRGCHLLAMFARTPVAKAFRRWVLDVLDRLAAEERAALPSSDTLTPEQQAQLQAIVAAKAGMVPASHRRRAFQEIWARFNNNFQIARYAQLPPAKIGEAVEYLVSMEVKALKKLPAADAYALAAAEPVPAPALPATDDIDGHFAAIREHIRQINNHEEAISQAVRKGMPPLRGTSSLALLIHRNMENAGWSLHYALQSLETSARIAVTAGQI